MEAVAARVEKSVTLSDEGTLVGGVLKRKKQAIHSDILGRTWKVETLNWDGSIYSTTTNSYNARDQVTRVFMQEGTNGTGHETLETYDGYGRLASHKAPIQTDPTVYAYNSDGTLHSETDARGAIKTLTYNNRHLVTGINHDLSGTSTGAIAFDYDEVGSRLWMTDDSGRVDYQYNSLSQLISETRQFTGLSGSYPLSYTYNVAGEVESVTDPTGVVVSYEYDKTGRLSDVKGSTYAGVSEYATAIRYRAFDAVKSLTYGNSQTLNQSYNARRQLTSFAVGSLLSADFQYHPDGQIRYARDNTDPKMDRAYHYDQAGRISEALSGAESRGESTADGVYRQTYQYDVWDNLTGKAVNRFWSGGEPFAITYVNDRAQGTNYDADGRVTRDANDRTHAYDAAGRQTTTQEVSRASSWATGGAQPNSPPGGYYTTTTLTIGQTYDEDGGCTKRVETKTQATPFYQPVTTQRVDYYVRSSVLGGEVITELTSAGAKRKTNVYAGGTVVAEQQLYNEGQQSITWKHLNPVTGTTMESGAGGAAGGKKDYDPFGLELGYADPYLQNEEPDYASMGGSFYREGGNPFGESDGCQWNGMPIRCRMFEFIFRTQTLIGVTLGRNVDSGFFRSARWVDTTDKSKINSRVTSVDENGNPTERPGEWSTPHPLETSGHWEFWMASLLHEPLAANLQNSGQKAGPCEQMAEFAQSEADFAW